MTLRTHGLYFWLFVDDLIDPLPNIGRVEREPIEKTCNFPLKYWGEKQVVNINVTTKKNPDRNRLSGNLKRISALKLLIRKPFS